MRAHKAAIGSAAPAWPHCWLLIPHTLWLTCASAALRLTPGSRLAPLPQVELVANPSIVFMDEPTTGGCTQLAPAFI